MKRTLSITLYFLSWWVMLSCTTEPEEVCTGSNKAKWWFACGFSPHPCGLGTVSASLPISPESRHIHHMLQSPFYSQSGVSFKRCVNVCWAISKGFWHDQMETSHVFCIFLLLSFLLGHRSRACFMVPTGYEFFPKLWCWYLILAQSLQLQDPWLGGQSQVKNEMWIVAHALAAQSRCVALGKPLHMSTQRSPSQTPW